MRKLLHPLLGLLSLLSVLSIVFDFTRSNCVCAAEVERVVVFRDGTLLKVSLPDEPLPWRRMTEDGRVSDEPVKLSQIDRLRLVRTPATDQVAVVRKLASQLGDLDFHKRELSQAEILKQGAKFRNILVEIAGRTSDMEVKWRLGVLLKALPAGQGLIDVDYDLLTLPDAEKPVAGDVAAWSPTVKYRGHDLKLDRASVAAIGKIPLLPRPPPGQAAPRSRRVEANDDRLFPAQVTRLDFERGPRGEELSEDRDIAQIFAPLGCTFAVSVPNSFISVQSYNVGGRSGGKCAATYSPRYQGTMIIRFCLPEHDRIPAGVRQVGVSVSHVAPGGTGLLAFDAFHRPLGEVWTTRAGTDFLALKCNLPIAYVKVAPNEEIDKDFAIDDLVFDPPQPLAESGDETRYSILLTGGERLYCKTVDSADGTVILRQLSYGAAEVELPAAEVAALSVPREVASPFAEAGKNCFIRLRDGSLILAEAVAPAREFPDLTEPAPPVLKAKRFPKLLLRQAEIVAIWGGRIAPDMPDDDAWPDGFAVLVEREKPAKPLGKWKLGAKWLELPDPFIAADLSYADSPPVWLRKPAPVPEGSGIVRMRSGEELVLSSAAFELKRWSSAAVVVARGEEETAIPLAEVASVVFPRQSKDMDK